MVFWIAVAVLAAAVTFAVTRPLLRTDDAAADEASAARADVEVYKHQLEEVDADRERGLLSPAEADAARAEIARRLLRRAEATEAVSGGSQDALRLPASRATPSRNVFAAASVVLPLASLGLYLTFGEPGLPAQPLSDRLAAPAGDAKTNDLVAKVEAALRNNPQDGRGWDVIAPVYLALGRSSDAATAFANAIRILGENPARLQGFADARIRTENGMVPDDARAVLNKLVAADATLKEPRIWLALAKEQDGDKAGAAADYRNLIKDAPADTPWRLAIEERLKLIEASSGSSSANSPSSAPPDAVTAPGQPQGNASNQSAKQPSSPLSPADVAAMDPEQRATMINAMVQSLAERLKTDKTDFAGWQKLIRAYQVLGRDADARRAIDDARAGLAGDEARLRDLQNWIKELGLAG